MLTTDNLRSVSDMQCAATFLPVAQAVVSWSCGIMSLMDQRNDHDPRLAKSLTYWMKYSAYTAVGRTLRKGEAKLQQRRMEEAEAETCQKEQRQRDITDRIARLTAEQELNIQYLIAFGVRASERQAFQRILRDTAEHGGLTLREAARLARAQTDAHNENSQFDVAGGESQTSSVEAS